MSNISVKQSGDQLTAEEHSPFIQSVQKPIVDTGGGLFTDDTVNFSKSLASYSAISTFYQCTGFANNYVLNPQGSFENVQNAPTTWNGAFIRFRPNINNAGATTIQWNGQPPQPLTKEDGTPLVGGELTTQKDVICRYNLATTSFFLINTTSSPATTTTQGTTFLSKQVQLSFNNVISLNYTDGNFVFDDGTGSATITAGTVDFTTVGVNGLDTGAIAPNIPYYLFAIYNQTTQASSVIASASKTAPTLPAGFTKKKYIGACHTNGSSEIRSGKWFDSNKKFLLTVAITEQTVNATTSTFPITVPPNTFAILDAKITLNQNGRFRFYAKELPNSFFYLENNWQVSGWSGGYNNRTIEILLDNNSQIGVIEDGGGSCFLYTRGWIDDDIL